MTDTAKEAFASRNYRLAVEMYERCMKQQSPSFEVLFGYGESLARCGRLRESVDVYSRCLALGGNVPTDKLRHLVNALLEELGLSTASDRRQSWRGGAELGASFACPECEGALYQPVSLDCGHTFCRACVLEAPSCKLCGQRREARLETNVLVQRLAEKWWPAETEASGARHEADAMLKKGHLGQALERYDLAVQLGE
ncbi:LON peptidase N-terminal domain and RING finger protein 3-like [Copidosoma floridanum]|uniref:LON peptidase N-terminal domain and RING finger protein 3-like n=1 Tax=Copidosoma floridanum TaxID=29053 RepID=UPI0006C9653C|nr:LON peptidase N-terminal domain and RING finger protein 3-like [Copidosoma floridanum]